MAIALIALFFALGGIGTAATTAIVPLAKRALSADNAKKLEKKSLSEVAAMPGPATADDADRGRNARAQPGGLLRDLLRRRHERDLRRLQLQPRVRVALRHDTR